MEKGDNKVKKEEKWKEGKIKVEKEEEEETKGDKQRLFLLKYRNLLLLLLLLTPTILLPLYYFLLSPLPLCLSLLTIITLTMSIFYPNFLLQLRSYWRVLYSCGLKPLKRRGGSGGEDEEKDRLERFYEDQKEGYDETRVKLLKGRRTLLKLCLAELKSVNKPKRSELGQDNKEIEDKVGSGGVWVDLGGGTGWNIERMEELINLNYFQHIYLVDLTPSLCQIARERVSRRGWDNVTVLCQNSTTFQLPDSDQRVSLVTLSYSLSMMEDYFKVLDRVTQLVKPDGVVGVVDFYVSGRTLSPTAIEVGPLNRQCNWFSRVFWQLWFEFDYVGLHPARRDYLEYKFTTIKTYSTRNHFLLPYLIQLPYYVWLGRPKSETSLVFNSLRLNYHPTLPCHTQFKDYIYGFTWEDPREDMRYLDNLTEEGEGGEILVLTSGGDNALHYLCHTNLKRLHCVDMNPHQNHLLELKSISLRHLDYSDVWKLWGEGHHPDFENLLDLKLSPHLSSHAYQFWKANVTRFTTTNFYLTGCSGYVLRMVRFLIRILNLTDPITQLCRADTIETQKKLWFELIRPKLLNRFLVNSLVNNPIFLWKATGVPINQWRMLLKEGSLYQYLTDTFDPIVTRSLLRDDQYFYHLCLMGHYSPSSCPDYLTLPGYRHLNTISHSPLHLHTTDLLTLLPSLTPSSLSHTLLMDHLDWYSTPSQITTTLQLLHTSLVPKGTLLFRSAARHPWYLYLFITANFQIEPLHIRPPPSNSFDNDQPNRSIDRVNMYASFYRANKI